MNKTFTRTELEQLKQKYGYAFYTAYKKQILEDLERQEAIDKLLDKRNEKQDTNKYGHLLDKYIK